MVCVCSQRSGPSGTTREPSLSSCQRPARGADLRSGRTAPPAEPGCSHCWWSQTSWLSMSPIPGIKGGYHELSWVFMGEQLAYFQCGHFIFFVFLSWRSWSHRQRDESPLYYTLSCIAPHTLCIHIQTLLMVSERLTSSGHLLSEQLCLLLYPALALLPQPLNLQR